MASTHAADSTPPRDAPNWLEGEQSQSRVSEQICAINLAPGPRFGWIGAFAFAMAFALMFVLAIGYLLATGIGIWGNNIPVAWAFDITNYVWWIGIGMAGTFISAALLLLRQDWRTSISRSAEAMTVCAVAIAGLFPLLHLGRPWFAYWLAPYPDIMNLWPQWRSALVWDFFAIVSYLSVSLLFWYVGMIPDFGTFRDRAGTRPAQLFYGLLALGWRGEARHWRRYETLSVLIAGLAVPLVFSVHSEVALSFCSGILPGWHSTLFPPFFVAGALFSGFALALALIIPMRAIYGLGDYITLRHLDQMAKLLLAASLFMAYSYLMDVFMAFYSADQFEIATTLTRMKGPYAPLYWSTLGCNVVLPQALWFKALRRNTKVLFIVSAGVVVGMWFERLMLIVTSLYRDFLPSSWGMYYPTVWDFIHLTGSMGLFAVFFLLFLRLLPIISMFETRKLIHKELKETP